MSIQTERSVSTWRPGSSMARARETFAEERSSHSSNFPPARRGHPYRNSERFTSFDREQLLRDGRDASLARDREFVDLDSELEYWRRTYARQTEHSGLRYGDREPAVKLGLDAYVRSRGRSMDDMEEELHACYERTRGASRLDWEQARAVVEAAWQRVVRNGGAWP